MKVDYCAAADGRPFFLRICPTPSTPKALCVVVHGMAEHGARYLNLAESLVQHNYQVYLPDLRGHGRSAVSADLIGHLDDTNGWSNTVADLDVIVDYAQREYPSLPVVLIGHSMGSLLVRDYVITHSERIAALVCSGTAASPGLLGFIGRIIATTAVRLRGPRAISALMDKLSFGSFNARFSPNRTQFDWLSRDQNQVDAYLADPWCGRISTVSLFNDLIRGTQRVNRQKLLTRIRPDLPVLLLSGDQDPVGAQGRGVRNVGAHLQRAGLKDVTVRLYRGARHEVWHETNSSQVVTYLLDWLDDRFEIA